MLVIFRHIQLSFVCWFTSIFMSKSDKCVYINRSATMVTRWQWSVDGHIFQVQIQRHHPTPPHPMQPHEPQRRIPTSQKLSQRLDYCKRDQQYTKKIPVALVDHVLTNRLNGRRILVFTNQACFPLHKPQCLR